MSDAATNSSEKPAKSGKKALILAVILAFVGGGVGFYAVVAGLIPIGTQQTEDAISTVTGSSNGLAHEQAGMLGTVNSPGKAHPTRGPTAFVPVDPITISLSNSQSARHLRFRAQLEVGKEYEANVKAVLPRVTDVLNSYLRALELDDLTGPLALIRLRAQMLRRVQVVVGKDQVRDLLVMEFVLN